MSDNLIIQALIRRDEEVTRQFFFKDCRPLFVSVIRKVFDVGEVDYDEFVSEFYVHIMENDAYRLRQFEGRSSIFQWMKVVAIRYFCALREKVREKEKSVAQMLEKGEEAVYTSGRVIARMDVEALLEQMKNHRHIYVIRRLVLNDAEPEAVAKELNVTVDNLYNIKKRALDALTRIALKC